MVQTGSNRQRNRSTSASLFQLSYLLIREAPVGQIWIFSYQKHFDLNKNTLDLKQITFKNFSLALFKSDRFEKNFTQTIESSDMV